MIPRTIVTDRLASYAAAKAGVLPSVSHLRRWRQSNRAENSHQPVRQRARRLQRFKSLPLRPSWGRSTLIII
jgi:putative transposase